jgi:hypothetical protein
MLIFNEGDAPTFDTSDEAFLGRMVVVPMRSKFVPAGGGGCLRSRMSCSRRTTRMGWIRSRHRCVNGEQILPMPVTP